MTNFWELLDVTYRTMQADAFPGDWEAVLAAFAAIPEVVHVRRVMNQEGHLAVAERSGNQTAAASIPPSLTEALLNDAECPALVDGRSVFEIGIPLRGHRAHYGWLWLTIQGLDRPGAETTLIIGRHMGALLGLWADVGGRDSDALRRMQTLYRTVLWGDHLILHALDEAEMVAATGTRLFDSALLTYVAIIHEASAVFEAGGLTRSGPASMTVVIHRGGIPWGRLCVQVSSPHAHDADVADLIQWFAELLGHGLDEWDGRHRLQEEEAQQRYLATHDGLTGLENRGSFLDAMPPALNHAAQTGTWLVVGMLDLDNFKPINDTYGHDAGDRLLTLWAQRMAQAIQGPHRMARIGGDEFAFWLSGLVGSAAVEATLADLFRLVSEPIGLTLANGMVVDVMVKASAGITVSPADPSDPHELLRHADLALYRAKERKTQRAQPWSWYESHTLRPSRHQAHIPEGIRVHYQPIVDVQSGHVHSLEALVRLWDGRTLWAPGQFLAELTSDELQQLTFQVLDIVLHDMQAIDAVWNTPETLSISLNLEPSMLSSDCIRHIGQQVVEAAIAPERITLELLETSDFLSQSIARHQLQVLKEKRFQLALDDVGSAYSSLLRIKELPIDTLKLDQAFVRHIPDQPDDLLFVIAMQSLARGFQSHFVAEGVEDTTILDALQVLGVDRVQGYVFTKPLPLNDLLVWGRRFRPIPADGQPHTLLGAYAAHLAYEVLDRVMHRDADNRVRAAACPLTRYLLATGQRHSVLAETHLTYHDAGSGDAPEQLKIVLMDALQTPDPASATVR